MKAQYIEYDESNEIEGEVNYLFEEDNPENRTKDEIYNSLDYQFLNYVWDDFKSNLEEFLSEINLSENKFKVKGVNMGWRNLDGVKTCELISFDDILKEILPNTNEMTLRIWKTKRQIKIICYHHDSPMGETYFIKPLNKKELREYNKD